MMMSELPVDVLSKIASYYLGEPEYMRLKHSKGLKQIQNIYKIHYTEPTIYEYRSPNNPENILMLDITFTSSGKDLSENHIPLQYEKIKKIYKDVVAKHSPKQGSQWNSFEFGIVGKYELDKDYDYTTRMIHILNMGYLKKLLHDFSDMMFYDVMPEEAKFKFVQYKLEIAIYSPLA